MPVRQCRSVRQYDYAYDDADNLISKTEPFIDDFDDGNLTGWTVGWGSLSASNGYVENMSTATTHGLISGSTSHSDGELRFSYSLADTSDAGYRAQLQFRFAWGDDAVLVRFRPGVAELLEQVDGDWTTLDSDATVTSAQGAWYDVRIVADGQDVTVWRGLKGGAMQKVLETSGCTAGSSNKVLFQATANSRFTFDDARLQSDAASTTTTFAYNIDNELTAMTKNAVATAFTYDAWGRTISKARAGHLVEYYCSHGGRLVMAETGDSDDVYYAYNGLGQRIRRSWSDDYSTDYYWNGWSVVNEYFSDDQEEQYGWSKTYVGGLAERAYAGGAYSYYFTDHLGSTEAAYNEAKSRTAGIDYTAWGEILATDGAASGITRRYTGHDYDPLTGDYFAPYRFYSPGSHRWLTILSV